MGGEPGEYGQRKDRMRKGKIEIEGIGRSCG